MSDNDLSKPSITGEIAVTKMVKGRCFHEAVGWKVEFDERHVPTVMLFEPKSILVK